MALPPKLIQEENNNAEKWNLRHATSEISIVNIQSGRRIGIPKDLRDYAKLSPDDEVILIGMNSYLEIWHGSDYLETNKSIAM